MANQFPKNPNAKALENIYYQEIDNYLIKEEKFAKRLEDCLTEKDELVKKTKLEKKKHEFRKKKKFASKLKSIRKFKQIPKHLMYDDPDDNKSYHLGLKTYDGDNKELQDVKSQKYSVNFDWFVIYEAKIEGKDRIIGKYYKILELNDIPKQIKMHINQ